MPKCYVFSVTKYADGSKETYSVTGYEDTNAALKVYHQKFYNAINGANIAHILVQIVNDFGVILKSEYWTAPVVEPEPTPEEEPEPEEPQE